MAIAAISPLVSERQFLALPESNERIELLDGEVIVSPSGTCWHQEVLRRLVQALSAWAVRELWTMDPAGLVERWTGPGLADRRQPRTRLTSPLLPGFRLELRRLFARRRAR